MTVWVLFFIITRGNFVSTSNYEFKDKNQCLNAAQNMKNNFDKNGPAGFIGFCQEVRK